MGKTERRVSLAKSVMRERELGRRTARITERVLSVVVET